jgi:hypothetical protein
VSHAVFKGEERVGRTGENEPGILQCSGRDATVINWEVRKAGARNAQLSEGGYHTK